MMTTAGDGAVDREDLELHVVFHDRDQPLAPGNIPPIFDFFYHLVFEDVTIEVSNTEDRSSES